MRFVLANRHLLATGGTEVHLVMLGEQLQRLGHEVLLYAPELGPFADHARRRGLDVVGSVRELPETCDVTFAQDGIVVYDLAERYPDALSVFRICGDIADFQLPPQLQAVVDLVVVLSDRYERLARACAERVPVLRLRLPVDVDRLVPLGAIRERPERAVVLGNYGERDQLVIDVWGSHGIEVRRVGGSTESYEVAEALADADIVVGKSRAVLDAMACGRAVYVFDIFGGDGWVTPELYAALEADHFAGQATDRVIDAAALAGDLSGYRREMGTVNRDLVLQHHRARDHTIALLAAIDEREPQERSPAPLRELARLTALQWSWELTAREFRSMFWPMREHVVRTERVSARAGEAARELARDRDHARARADALEAQLADARSAAGEVAALRAELEEREARIEAMRSTRAWRLASVFWRIRSRIRGAPRGATLGAPATKETDP